MNESFVMDVIRRHFFLSCLSLVIIVLFITESGSEAFAEGWTVTIRAHRIEALTNSDNWGEQDMYWRAHMKATIGSGGPVDCDTEDDHPDDDNIISVDWACTLTAVGGLDTTVGIHVEVWDEDTIGDDELDLSIDHSQLGLEMLFEPRTSKLTIIGDPTWPAGQCAFGRIKRSGFGGGGGEPADIVFSITASPANAPDGDSDSDGLPDSWELCGVDGNGDGLVDVDLPALGADMARKDVFAEIDWMVDASGASGVPPHSHEPWLPAMINAWNEFNVAPVTNPTIGGVVKPGGLALHLDVGTLYANYQFDIDGNGTPEQSVPVSGNLDLNGDGIPDIGNLSALGRGKQQGGNALAEDLLLSPPATVTGMPTASDMFAPGSEFAALKGANFAPSRESVFHYTIFGHAYTQVQGGLVNSSGLSEPCGFGPCNELMVTLSTFDRQRIDADRDGIPDIGGAIINGPAGVPVDGLIGDHVGTFLHELGHNLRLGHGGSDIINFKPNYPSIMNYHWQTTGLAYDWDGNGLADNVGFDFDGDGIQDVRRFQYFTRGAGPVPAPLNEASLNETLPVIPGTFVFIRYTCPPAGGGVPPLIIPQRADRPANWNCNGNPTEINVSADINNVNLSSGTIETLGGFDDYNWLQSGVALDLDPTSGISSDEQRRMENATQRIIEPSGRQEIVNQCVSRRRLDFDSLARGTSIQALFAPQIEFLGDAVRTPTIAAPGDRNNVPTASPAQSLINLPRGGAISPLVFSFGRPQRILSLRFGQAGLTHGPAERTRLVLEAFDQNDLSMGIIAKPLPPPSQGITGMVTVAAVFPDQLIHRVEIHYEFGLAGSQTRKNPPIAEPVQIDDLVFCEQLDESVIKPSFPPPPKWGDLPVNLRVTSEALLSVPGNGEPGNTTTVHSPFTGLPFKVDGAAATTDMVLTRPEGTTLKLKAPETSSVGPFLYWRYESGVSFGRGVTEIPLTLLRDGILTAVYRGRNCSQRCEGMDENERPVQKKQNRHKD